VQGGILPNQTAESQNNPPYPLTGQPLPGNIFMVGPEITEFFGWNAAA